MLKAVIEHLRELVACDTTNPPRAIGADHPALRYACDVLGAAGFEIESTDLGGGSVNLLARRGRPATLVNCHLDTVPPDSAWTRDPFDLLLEGGRAIGLGACDVKGAAACLLAACEQTTGDAAILLTTDEEAGSSACVRSFLQLNKRRYKRVVVSEPTGARAVVQHHGIVSVEIEFKGDGGHASGERARSALHDAVRWGAEALRAAGEADTRGESWRLNLGQVSGGVKPNMVASEARVRFGLRPRTPGEGERAMRDLRAALPRGADSAWTTRFTAPPLLACDESRALADDLGVDTAPGVDFWTEAALFAHAGLPAVVFGPGDIRQAHRAGEFVTLDQLEIATSVYTRLFSAREDA